MKTIISIVEVILYNLLPATLAAPVILILKDVVPLIGLAVARVGAYIIAGLQKIHHDTFSKPEEEPVLELEKYNMHS